MICSMIRSLRNAISHFGCDYNNETQNVLIKQEYKGKLRI